MLQINIIKFLFILLSGIFLISPERGFSQFTESCPNLRDQEAKARRVVDESGHSWFTHFGKCVIVGPAYYALRGDMDKWIDHCKKMAKFKNSEDTHKTLYEEVLQDQQAQNCGPPGPPSDAECTATQNTEKETLEEIAITLDSKVLCGPALRAQISLQALEAGGTSSEVISDCDCALENPKDSEEIEFNVAGLKPEDAVLAQKVKDALEKQKKGDESFASDFDKLSDTTGQFAGTDQGAGSQSPEEAALDALSEVFAGQLSDDEEKSKSKTKKKDDQVSFGGGAGTAPAGASDKKDNTFSKYWKQKALDKKNGISGNPRRGIFAQVSSRYAVKSTGMDKILNVKKGRFHDIKEK
jgi:hypothetical protein